MVLHNLSMKKVFELSGFNGGVFLLMVLSSLGSELFANGLDLGLSYGSRYVNMGGNQVSLANDAYAPFYNPAGMMGLEGASFAADLSSLILSYEAPIGGANAQRTSDISVNPLFYFGGAKKLNEWIALGIGFYPTALQGATFSHVNYGAGLRDKEFSDRLVRLELSPSLALKVIDPISVGVSWRLGYTRYDKSGGAFGVPGQALYLASSVSAWDAKGVKLGAFLNNWNGLSAAMTYRFEIDTQLQGQTDVDGGAGAAPASTTQNVKLPAQFQAGISYEWIPKKLTTALGYEYTISNVIEADRPVIQGLPPAATATPLHWKNGHTVHVGGEYVFDLGATRKLRTGLGFCWDKGVTRNTEPSPVVAPAADYYGYSAGAQFEQGSNTYGLGLNYGQYAARTAALDYPSASIFPGKYSLKILLAVLDYQFRF